jgi:hypothetical protein
MFTASFVAAGAGSVGIASAGTTSGNHSIGGGNQVSVPISIPVSICGNAVALLGGAFAGCNGGASVSHDSGDGSSAGPRTSGNESILGGNQVRVPVSVPVSVCGNAVAVLGAAFAGCEGGAWTGAPMSTSATGMTHLLAQRSYGGRAMPARSVVQHSALTGAAAGLTRLPVLAGLAGSVSQAAGSSAATARPAQATLLSASSPAAPGMGSGSLFALAFGALLAGAASLIAAGRRLGVRKAGR